MSRPIARRNADKPITWMGDSKERISGFPLEVKKELGYGLRQAQMGVTHENAKLMHGDLSGVTEMVTDATSGTYRAVYTTNLGETLYVLHCFQKKSKSGISTPKRDLKLIRKRLRAAKELYERTKKERDTQ